jgi:hypothetical protein
LNQYPKDEASERTLSEVMRQPMRAAPAYFIAFILKELIQTSAQRKNTPLPAVFPMGRNQFTIMLGQ